ncbi:hypothetical protein ABZ281_01490 [Streptomyces sp. NPDC006265]|uniref:hypothetical protein n=1 Tax=Streptomyces sp. NPDC006265 TaxID=3156740 RepID=UPI0033A5F1E9
MNPDIIEDYESDEDHPQSNPFPGADKVTWTRTFSVALHETTGLPLEITDGLAPYIVHPKDYLLRQRGEDGAEYRIKPGVINRDPSTGLDIMEVTVHGFAGTPGEYNERIRRFFHSPARHNSDPARMLPRLVTGRHEGALPAAFLTTAAPVDSQTLSGLIGTMTDALDQADGDRGYKLIDDMQVYGQNETTLHALLLRQVREPVKELDGGITAQVRRVLDATAVKGANRSRARLALHGLVPKDIIFGIDRGLLGLDGVDGVPAKVADPAVWVPAFAERLRVAFDDERHSLHGQAKQAAMVATVRMQIIVGTSAPEDFHNVVFDPNRADHRRPPLGYTLVEKAASDLRAVLRDAKQRGWISEEERAWLAGEGPDPEHRPGEGIVTARDRRDRALYAVVFPKDPARARALRRVLGEPARYATSKDHVWHRLRMVSSVIGEGYSFRWNPRVLDGLLSSTFIKFRGHLAEEPAWDKVIGAVSTADQPLDLDALDRFLTTRGIHWLAECKIIEADRGSIGAQSGSGELEDGETVADKKIRRSTINARKAMLSQPRRTIGLMNELARATAKNTTPRQVDPEGLPIEDTKADKSWFDTVFPKAQTKRPPTFTLRGSSTDGTTPQPPDPTPLEIFNDTRGRFYDAVTGDLPTALVEVLKTARSLLSDAQEAGQRPLHGAVEQEIAALLRALSVVHSDVGMLKSAIIDMQYGNPTIEESASEKFLTEASDSDEDDDLAEFEEEFTEEGDAL